MASSLSQGHPVLCHCSDGWDRTAQFCALAQLLLDPYFRTIAGLKTLIEKEFATFGHKFRNRSGGFGFGSDASQYSPVFPQFIDCVYQLWRQVPTQFEYDERLLLLLLRCYNSGFTADFAFNNARERAAVAALTQAQVHNSYTQPAFVLHTQTPAKLWLDSDLTISPTPFYFTYSISLNRTQSHSIALNRTQSHSIALNRTQSADGCALPAPDGKSRRVRGGGCVIHRRR
jgi:hypothetical protein